MRTDRAPTVVVATQPSQGDPTVRATTVLRKTLGIKNTRVTGFELEGDALMIDVRPTTRRRRCGSCGKKCPGYDERARKWRHLDFGDFAVFLRYTIRRVECRRCAVTTELVPWAPPGSGGFTYAFEERVAYLAQRCDQTTVCRLMRLAWRSVGAIARRVSTRLRPADPLQGLTHIGVDEISYRKHHKYVTVVVDHLLGRIIWASEGRNAETLGKFFGELGEARTAKLKIVTIDMAQSYISAVRKHAPQAEIIFDRFHVQRLVHDAVDEVRRAQVRELKGTEAGDDIKRTRYSLLKSPWNLSLQDKERLSTLAQSNRPLYRAYLLKEAFCGILDRRQVNVARQKLEEWLAWASRSRLKPIQKVARTIRKHLEGILAYVRYGLSNGRVEGLNRKARVVTRRAYGFHSAESLIGYLLLCCGGIDLDPVFNTAESHP